MARTDSATYLRCRESAIDVPEVAEQEEQDPAQSPATTGQVNVDPESGAPIPPLRLSESPCTWRHMFWCWCSALPSIRGTILRRRFYARLNSPPTPRKHL